MTRIFITKANISGDTVTVYGADSAHIASSLRMKRGESIVFCDGEGTDYFCRIETTSPSQTTAAIESSAPSESEPECRIHLFQSLCKGDKFEFIIQKATELGVYSVTPVISERCVSRPDDGALGKKLARWRTIAREAAQQSGRGAIPQVTEAVRLPRAFEIYKGRGLFCYENERALTLKQALEKAPDMSVFVGPEGGYSPAEHEAAVSAGLVSVSLGRRILRAETAPLFALGAIIYEFEL